MKQFLIAATVIAGLFCLPALVEWGAHNPAWIGLCAFLLVCIGFAVAGPVADLIGEKRHG